MKTWIPDSVFSRTLLVLVAGLTISHALSVALYFTDRTNAILYTGGEHIEERMLTITRLVESASAAERLRIVELSNQPRLQVTLSSDSAIEAAVPKSWNAQLFWDSLVAHFQGKVRLPFRYRFTNDIAASSSEGDQTAADHGHVSGAAVHVSIQLPDKTWLNFVAPVEPSEPFWSVRFVLSLAVMLVAVAILTAVVVHHMTKPLATFARAAQRLGVNVKAPAVPEKGPAEVRQAIRAFNEMQDRIRRFVEDRTQMIAAISHDLGTPITRMRLRSEFVDDEEQRQKMLADLDDMEKMVASALAFARDEAACEPRTLVDMRTLLQRVCEDLSDSGKHVVLEPIADPLPYACLPVAMRRALTNVIENAVKYGCRAHVFLGHSDRRMTICVDDDGPGIPEDRLQDAFRPFVRLEASRNPDTGGTGLGLTVARTIIRGHGGDLTLKNRPEGGLRAEVRLPSQ